MTHEYHLHHRQPPWTDQRGPSLPILILCAAALDLVGCGGAGEAPGAGRRTGALATTQGRSLQGRSLQGTSLQGISLQGVSLQGRSLQGISLHGSTLQGQSLQGTRLAGADLIGASLTAADSSGAPVELRIADVQVDPHDPSGDITLYALEVWSAEAGEWQNICAPDPYGERWAIPASGTWTETGAHVDDPALVTFACTSGVIAKCMRWGYKPWQSVNGTSLAPYHQACTRMARADYCGDGVSHTRDGTLIDLYDNLGIQVQTPDTPELLFEGSWTPDGAYCIGKERWQGLIATVGSGGPCNRKLDLVSTKPVRGDEPGCHYRLQPDKKQSVILYNRSSVNVLSSLSP